MLDTGPHWENYTEIKEIFETIWVIVFLQFLIALISIKVLIPKLLNQHKKAWFFLSFFGLLLLGSELSVLYRYFYIESVYPETYSKFLQMYGHLTLQERTLSLWSFKYIFFSKVPLMLFPAAVLIAHDFYQNQQYLLQIREQKNHAELTALKNQLNPHFIFNTLNNLYFLAITKSDKTPEVIEKLSDILDYMLYRCSEKYVSLNNEIKLINNYLGLERIRYGDRLIVDFTYSIKEDMKIAPLILLNLVENACKHSTSQEINKAIVSINLTSHNKELTFNITNTKPKTRKTISQKNGSIGLKNLIKQLELLYPESHELLISDSIGEHQVNLRIIES
jgi:sensor histidine kinase YesM